MLSDSLGRQWHPHSRGAPASVWTGETKKPLRPFPELPFQEFLIFQLILALSFNIFFLKAQPKKAVGCLPEIPAANQGAPLHPISNTSEEFKPLKICSEVEEISAHGMGELRQKLSAAPTCQGTTPAWEQDPENGSAWDPQDRSQKPQNPGEKHSSVLSHHVTATTELAGHREGLWCLQLWWLGHPKYTKNELSPIKPTESFRKSWVSHIKKQKSWRNTSALVTLQEFFINIIWSLALKLLIYSLCIPQLFHKTHSKSKLWLRIVFLFLKIHFRALISKNKLQYL